MEHSLVNRKKVNVGNLGPKRVRPRDKEGLNSFHAAVSNFSGVPTVLWSSLGTHAPPNLWDNLRKLLRHVAFSILG